MKRNRNLYLLWIIIVILLGLASRKFTDFIPGFLADYAGDTLWALLVFLIFGFVFTKKTTLQIGIFAIFFSFLIEISQLYHAPWIDAIRNTTLGALVLGFGFLWTDLICYTIGVFIGIFVEKMITIKSSKSL